MQGRERPLTKGNHDVEKAGPGYAGESVLKQHQAISILSSVGTGIYSLDRQARTTFANPAVVWMTKWTIEEIIGRTEHELFHRAGGNDSGSSACPLCAAIADIGEGHALETDYFRKDHTA